MSMIRETPRGIAAALMDAHPRDSRILICQSARVHNDNAIMAFICPGIALTSENVYITAIILSVSPLEFTRSTFVTVNPEIHHCRT